MDCFDRRILQFVLAWAPYGGPADDDVFLEFGIAADELLWRFHRIVAMQTKCARELDNFDRSLLARASAHVARTDAANGHRLRPR
jgi:hypothetical protein